MSRTVMLVLCLSLSAFAQQAHYRHNGKVALPDLKATPGVADAALTKEKLCAKAFHTRDERNVTQSMKKKVCRLYGAANCPSHAFEIDHLVSIELGGSNDIRNLWPQPAPSFRRKDVLENYLHRQVCSGNMTLVGAQTAIRDDWFKAYQQMTTAQKKSRKKR